MQRAVGREIEPGDRTSAAVEHGDNGAITGALTDSQLPAKHSVGVMLLMIAWAWGHDYSVSSSLPETAASPLARDPAPD